MSTREYIGARYVPLFAEPLQWDATRTYEPLTVVLYQGNSYTSRQAVPANIDISNQTYWAQTGNYNAQIEQYRQEVQTFDGRITQNATDISDEETARRNADNALGTRIDNEASERSDADTALGTQITNLGTAIDDEASARSSADTALGTRITNEANARQDADNALDARLDELEADEYMVIIGDSYSDPNDGSAVGVGWYDIVANYYGYKQINVAIGGSGFFKNGYTGQDKFSAQITKAASLAVGKKVSLVIMFGGMNDVDDTSITASNLATEVRSCLTAIMSNFSDARVIVAGIAPHYNFDSYGNNAHQWDYGRIMEMTAYMNYATGDFSATSKRGVKFIDFSKVGPFITDYFVSDSNFHPTVKGHRQLAFRMLGGNLDNDRNSLSHMTDAHRPSLTNGTDTVYGTCECKQVGPNLISIQSTFPAIAGNGGNLTMKLNGLPVGPGYILAMHNNSGLISGAYAISKFSKNYTVPLRNSTLQSSSGWSISYTIEV